MNFNGETQGHRSFSSLHVKAPQWQILFCHDEINVFNLLKCLVCLLELVQGFVFVYIFVLLIFQLCSDKASVPFLEIVMCVYHTDVLLKSFIVCHICLVLSCRKLMRQRTQYTPASSRETLTYFNRILKCGFVSFQTVDWKEKFRLTSI